VCKDNGGYGTAELNEKIFLNFHGFHKISNLEPYTALRAIFLEGNCLDSIEGLPALEHLRCLFAQQNCIREISHLEGSPLLDTLNLSNNRIKAIPGAALRPLTALSTLHLAHNSVETREDVEGLLECPSLSVVDLSNNKIEDVECLEVLKRMPNLKCLYLQGNPVVSAARHYRKSMIAALKGLSYLDDRPVFELERVCAEAWAEGGLDAEREARRRFKEAEAERDRANFEAMLQIKREGWRLRRERLGLPPGDTDPEMDDLSSDSFSGGEEEEPPELVAARRRLAQYSARPGEAEPADLTAARRELAREGVPIQEATWQTDGGDGLPDLPGPTTSGAPAPADGDVAGGGDAGGDDAGGADAMAEMLRGLARGLVPPAPPSKDPAGSPGTVENGAGAAAGEEVAPQDSLPDLEAVGADDGLEDLD